MFLTPPEIFVPQDDMEFIWIHTSLEQGIAIDTKTGIVMRSCLTGNQILTPERHNLRKLDTFPLKELKNEVV